MGGKELSVECGDGSWIDGKDIVKIILNTDSRVWQVECGGGMQMDTGPDVQPDRQKWNDAGVIRRVRACPFYDHNGTTSYTHFSCNLRLQSYILFLLIKFN